MKLIITILFVCINFYANCQKNLIVEYKIFENASEYTGTLNIPIKKTSYYYEQLVITNKQSNQTNEISNAGIDITPASEYKKKNYQIYKLESKQISNVLYLGDKPVLCNESLLPIKWEILTERKLFGEYNCIKAKCSFRGRKYIAWFTTQIPTQVGPWKFTGLPGLIIEIKDESQHYSWNVTKLKYVDKSEELIIDQNLKQYSLKEYEEKNFEYYNKVLVEKAKQFLAKFAKTNGVNSSAISFDQFAKNKEGLRTRELKYEWD